MSFPHDIIEVFGAVVPCSLKTILLKGLGPGDSFRPSILEDPVVKKNLVVRDIADRCLAGEFGGSYRAAKEPECAALGICHQLIQYHMDQKHPLAAAARAGERRGSLLRQRRQLQRMV